MPPKDYDPNKPIYFLGPDGKIFKPSVITDADLADVDFPGVDISLFEGTLTFTLKSPEYENVILRSLLTGMPIPNNWLKMHGYPMRRKCRKRRC